MQSKKKRQKTKHAASATDTRPLSQAEIWDDSALIRSWNDALAEYEYYHGIHARGEDVEEILRRAEAGELDDDDHQQQTRVPRQKAGQSRSDTPAVTADTDGINGHVDAVDQVEARAGDGDDEAEEGEVVEEADDADVHAADARPEPSVAGAGVSVAAPMIGPGLPPPPPGRAETAPKANAPTETGPSHLPPPAQDQTLENIKMAYYWAGYYSGLYDGQRQAQLQHQAQ
ncbi:hypothetical protein PV04_06752 [Phialophora macrospora]|uniref:Survival Motor Neuron Gemin2-binding domain-containing protein n=1 Tax=Phialophora macrospora TaxID=1851006 RepID=A0A0D2FHL6_9EURO|nr:hypothetical protein PV04_06752 [Phialophora macrospora]